MFKYSSTSITENLDPNAETKERVEQGRATFWYNEINLLYDHMHLKLRQRLIVLNLESTVI